MPRQKTQKAFKTWLARCPIAEQQVATAAWNAAIHAAADLVAKQFDEMEPWITVDDVQRLLEPTPTGKTMPVSYQQLGQRYPQEPELPSPETWMPLPGGRQDPTGIDPVRGSTTEDQLALINHVARQLPAEQLQQLAAYAAFLAPPPPQDAPAGDDRFSP